jgi:TetR/AcrR family transcriptional regulator, transcriptional repressor for nem operon
VPRISVRERLLEAALDEFHRHGFNGCGVKDITEAAGVPTGSFYNHFVSKEALALETISRYGQSRRLDMLADSTQDPLTRLRAHFEFLREELQRSGFTRGCMFANFGNEMAGHSVAVRAAVEAGLSRWSGAVAAVLREAQESRSLPAGEDVERCGRFLVDAWEGAVIRARVTQSSAPLDDFFAVAFDALL